MQRPHREPTSADKCVMLPQQNFDGLILEQPEIIRNFLHNNIAWNWFEAIINSVPDIPTLKEEFMKRFNSLGLTL